jgi:hypothetical protein
MKKLSLLIVTILLISSCGSETEVTNDNTDTAIKTNTENVVAETEDRDAEMVSMQPEYKAELY